MILLAFIFLLILAVISKVNLYKDGFEVQSKIPKIIMQTYIDRDKVPQKVFDNMKKYAPEYEYLFFNNEGCLRFLKEHFDQTVLNAYNTLEHRAHKADLFRYCFLYKKGGVYMDIKTELIKPLSDIIKKNIMYTVLSINKNTIYQGIIATKPHNPFFLKLIKHCVSMSKKPNLPYRVFTSEFYIQIEKETGKAKPGYNKNLVHRGNDYYLFTEKCSKNANDCYDGLDRHGFCCFVWDGGEKIIKTRYADYPWK